MMRRNKIQRLLYLVELETKVASLEHENQVLRASLDETTALVRDKLMPALVESSRIVGAYVEELKRRRDDG
jgi:hypothetical protein